MIFQEAWDKNNTKVSIMYEDLTNYPANNQNNCNEELLHDLKTQNPLLNIKNAEIQTFWDKVKKTYQHTFRSGDYRTKNVRNRNIKDQTLPKFREVAHQNICSPA